MTQADTGSDHSKCDSYMRHIARCSLTMCELSGANGLFGEGSCFFYYNSLALIHEDLYYPLAARLHMTTWQIIGQNVVCFHLFKSIVDRTALVLWTKS